MGYIDLCFILLFFMDIAMLFYYAWMLASRDSSFLSKANKLGFFDDGDGWGDYDE